MLLPYYGEFLVSPFPIELSLGRCTHACSYCFSRANGYTGYNGYTAIINSLARTMQGKKKDLASQLIREGYPLVLSNRSDPFSFGNYRDTLNLLNIFEKHNIGVYFQTKGGNGALQAARNFPPSAWYISISFSDEALRKQYEPGAPSLDERFALIRELKEYGHAVHVGINPLCREWIGDYEKLILELKALKVDGIWVERLHLNPKQIKALTVSEQTLLRPQLEHATKRQSTAEVFSFLTEVRCFAEKNKIPVFTMLQPTPSSFWDVIAPLYKKRFSTNQDFINYCWSTKRDGESVAFNEWFDIVGAGLSEELYPLDSVIYTVARNLHQNKIPRYMTYKQLFAIIWENVKHAKCPANYHCFAFELSEHNDSGGNPYLLTDDTDLPYILFNRAGFNTFYCKPSTI